MKRLFLLAMASMSWWLASTAASDNLLLGRPATFFPAPNYPLSTDEEDARQLTDGRFAPRTSPMWADVGAVAWRREEMALICFDLGQPQPLGVLSFYSASRTASGVAWPTSLAIYLSEDGELWQEVGDIATMERARGTFPAPSAGDDYKLHRFMSEPLNLQARHIAIAAKGMPYLAVDEIELSRGADTSVAIEPSLRGVEGIRKAFRISSIWSAITQRIERDRVVIKRAIQNAEMSKPTRERLLLALQSIELEAKPPKDFEPYTFQATFPLTSAHEQLFAIQAELWREQGHYSPLLSTAYRYDWLPHLHPLPITPASAPSLAFHQMQGERRGELLLLSNPTSAPITFQVEVKGDASFVKALRLYDSRWTDTPAFIAVSDVLLPLKDATITIPVGVTTKIWVNFDSHGIAQGQYQGEITFSSDKHHLSAPLAATVSPVALKPSRLASGMWDYTLKQSAYGVTPRNAIATAKIAREGGINVSWVPASLLPWPEDSAFASDDEMAQALDFAVLKERIRTVWPDADLYAFFLGETKTLGGASLGSEEFIRMLRVWLAQFEKALDEIGIPLDKVALLTIDEPIDAEKAELSLLWTKAIRATGSKVQVFTDPVWHNFQALPKDYIEAADIVCPNIHFLEREGKAAIDYFQQLRKQGKELWFYLCAGPVREVDPVSYYRLAHWYVFHYQGKGIGFWSLSDTGGAISSWLGHTATNTAYSPLFLDPESANISIHWKAIQEGQFDFSYFSMLREARGKHPQHAKKIDALLKEVAAQLPRIPKDTGNGATLKNGFWPDAESSKPIEEIRLRALRLLEEMH